MLLLALSIAILAPEPPTTPPKLPPRTYDATFDGCYDGDTCTFDVQLSRRSDGDWGLNIHDAEALQIFARTSPLLGSSITRVNQHVRLCDINAPELHPGEPAAAVKARDDLVGWIKAAKKVQLVVPQGEHGDEYEKYGRLLVYIMADGVNLNEKQLAAGNAKPFIKCR